MQVRLPCEASEVTAFAEQPQTGAKKKEGRPEVPEGSRPLVSDWGGKAGEPQTSDEKQLCSRLVLTQEGDSVIPESRWLSLLG